MSAVETGSAMADKYAELLAERDELAEKLKLRTHQIGVACHEHDLTHALACGRCYQELIVERDELAKDTRRLNWLAAHPRLADICVDGRKSEGYVYVVAGALGLTLREVIDAAMSKGDL